MDKVFDKVFVVTGRPAWHDADKPQSGMPELPFEPEVLGVFADFTSARTQMQSWSREFWDLRLQQRPVESKER
jgi:hypothetical protein